MPTYVQLMNSNPAAYGSAGNALAGLAGRVDGARGTFRTQAETATAPGTWSGRDRDAADRKAQEMHRSLEHLGDQVRQAGRALDDAAHTIGQARTQLQTFSGQIRAQGWIIQPTGVVVLGPPQQAQVNSAGPGAPAVLAGLQTAALTMTGQIFAIVGQASSADVAGAEWLLNVSAGLGGPGALPVNPDLREHLYDGHRRPKKISGYHVRPGGVDGSHHGFTIDPATTVGPDANGLYQARVHGTDLTGNPKSKPSTFFPDGWTADEINQAIRGAFYSRRPVQAEDSPGDISFGNSKWRGRYRGIDFEGWLKPGADWATAGPDDIATAYPVM